jgi:hypothetical protein
MQSLSVSSEVYDRLKEYASSVGRPIENVAEEALSRSAALSFLLLLLLHCRHDESCIPH